MANRQAESTNDRFDRFSKTKARFDVWHSRWDDIYEYVNPSSARFFDEQTKGNSITNEVFDSTPIEAIHTFANNLQFIMMPPYRRWTALNAGDAFTDISLSERKEINEELQDVTDTLFTHIDNSNFNLAVNEAFQDLAIGTAVIAINEGDSNNPFSFISIPMSEIYFEEGAFGAIESFWREWKITLRQIMRNWPSAILPPSLKDQLTKNLEMEVHLIEGSIYYPDNEEGFQYYYYVQLEENKLDIYFEWKDYSSFIGFRYTKVPGEIVGRGPADFAFGFIRVLNKLTEYELKSAKFHLFPTYLAVTTGIVNPANIRIEPGAIIPIVEDFASTPPLQPLPTAGNPQFAQLTINELRVLIREMLFAEPLPPVGFSPPGTTATEIAIRQQNFIQKNGASAARLASEFINPLITTLVKILRKKGIIRDIETSRGLLKIAVNNKLVKINYKSPQLAIQNTQDVQNFVSWMTLNTQMFQENGLIATQMMKVPQWAAEKMDVDLTLVNDENEIKKQMAAITEQVERLQIQQQTPQLTPPQVI